MCVITVAIVILSRKFGAYGTIFMIVCVVILVAMVVLKEFGPYDKIYDCV
jgi:hypothetical protein